MRQSQIWHRCYPPASVLQALGTTCGHPLTEADMRVFGGLDIVLRARGWSFIGDCSDPETLTFNYQPSDISKDRPPQGLQPITTIVVTLDRSAQTNLISDCRIEILLVGTPSSQARITGLSGLTKYLDLIEAHRPGIPTPAQFPFVRVRLARRADHNAAGASRR
ncbi:hypothetical protein [Nocardia implantans]|uniref:Uncharacterized protein n=1 Tax=Nocardia implantans TaxID=3108168 RepID=A0ABU6AVE6_9NOCA|nr:MULTISPECIES: hypothetical protein [unclassified Nocardia]MBF6192374.1 hypothetical protein [Nocardia beijingensis]MEA3527723.1 hypothetical protein [Nocardia sp. CDC192]MEB3511431.1 hypothetical protein [Nocardia sp. CDC186]